MAGVRVAGAGVIGAGVIGAGVNDTGVDDADVVGIGVNGLDVDDAMAEVMEDWGMKSWGRGVPFATNDTAEDRSFAVKKRSSRSLAMARMITCSKSLGRSGFISSTWGTGSVMCMRTMPTPVSAL